MHVWEWEDQGTETGNHRGIHQKMRGMKGDQGAGPHACVSRKSAGVARNHQKATDVDEPEVYLATAAYATGGHKVPVGGRAGMMGIPSKVEREADHTDMV
jgi:hypothetical protein